MKSVVAMALGVGVLMGAPCGPQFQKIVDPQGNPLPADTAFVAWVEVGPRTGMVFRPTAGDIEELIARLDPDEVEDPRMLTAAFWQEMRCRVVNNRCTGECPIVNNKKLRCLAVRPDDPGPPTNPPPKPPHKKHSSAEGTGPAYAQVSSLRCRCQ